MHPPQRVVAPRIEIAALLLVTACSSPGAPPADEQCSEGATHALTRGGLAPLELFHTSSLYFVNLEIGAGDGVQELPFAIDTGSASLVAQGNPDLCPTCSGHPRYAPSGSSEPTASGSYALVFGSGSGTAQTYVDDVKIGCEPSSRLSFAVLNEAQGMPNILGLAYASLVTPGEAPAFFDQIAAEDELEDVFSLLLCGSKGGHLTLGKAAENIDIGSAEYTPILEESYYVVDAKEVRVKGAASLGTFPSTSDPSLDRPIVDSGTTMLLLPDSIVTPLVEEMKQRASAAGLAIDDGFWESTDSAADIHKATITDEQIALFPELELVLADMGSGTVVVEIAPQTYLRRFGYEEAHDRVFAIRATAGRAVLGQVFLENSYVIFDRENQRIGLIPNEGLCSGPQESTPGDVYEPADLDALEFLHPAVVDTSMPPTCYTSADPDDPHAVLCGPDYAEDGGRWGCPEGFGCYLIAAPDCCNYCPSRWSESCH